MARFDRRSALIIGSTLGLPLGFTAAAYSPEHRDALREYMHGTLVKPVEDFTGAVQEAAIILGYSASDHYEAAVEDIFTSWTHLHTAGLTALLIGVAYLVTRPVFHRSTRFYNPDEFKKT